MPRSISIKIADRSQVGEARRLAAVMARSLEFSETEAGKVSIVVTELAGNLAKHAQHGEILLRRLHDRGQDGLEILCVDKGPGMLNVAECLRDGYSTAGSPGTGLGAVLRLSALCDIYSQPNKGAALVAHLWAKAGFEPTSEMQVGAVCVPIPGEEVCGDRWHLKHDSNQSMLLVADGLGHGRLAATAADEAVRIFEENSQGRPVEILHAAHAVLRSTRGASVAIAELNRAERLVRFAGVGNISGAMLGLNGSRNMVSHNGTLGHELHRIQEFEYPWLPDGLLVMHSDGLQTRWNLDSYPGLRARHPSLIAGVLYRDFTRGRDDVTVVAVRERT